MFLQKIIFAFIMCMAVACDNWGNTAEKNPKSSEAPKPKAHEFPSYSDWLNTGKAYHMADFKGRFVLLDFWTYGCISCQHVIPILKQLEEEFPDLVVIGVHSAKFLGEQTTQHIRKAVERFGIKHPVVNDYKFELWNQYGMRAWPSFVLIDPDGYIFSSFSGEGFYAKLRPQLSNGIARFKKAGKLQVGAFAFAPEDTARPKSLLSFPSKIEADPSGNRLFVTDAGTNRIVIFRPSGEIVDVIGNGTEGNTDGDFSQTSFNKPGGVALDAANELLYISDGGNHLIRMADLRKRKVMTVFGNGQKGTLSGLIKGIGGCINSPEDVCLIGNTLYIAMAGFHQLWKFDTKTREGEPYAGNSAEALKDGELSKAAFAQTTGLVNIGKRLFAADPESSSIRIIGENWVETLVGKGLFEYGDVDGKSDSAKLQHPQGICQKDGNLYIADSYNHKIKLLDPLGKTLKTYLGSGVPGFKDGNAKTGQLYEPTDMTWLGGLLYISDGNNNLIRIYNPINDSLTTMVPKKLAMLKRGESALAEEPASKGNEYVLNLGVRELFLNFTLSEGFEFNKEAPAFIDLFDDENGVVKTIGFKFVDGVYQYHVPVKLRSGKGHLRLRADIYYCDYRHAGMCYMEHINTDFAVSVKEGGSTAFRIDYKVK
ncbi:MAG: redoxin domain-containing protein [Flavobacteriaceae bacterium]|nr:redoxin domain-containing protein [Flavobacteriaceae bacterium]